MLNYYAGGYEYRIPKPGLVLTDGLYDAIIQFPGMLIRYTSDGSNPESKSSILQGPVKDDGKRQTFMAFDSKGRDGHISELSERKS